MNYFIKVLIFVHCNLIFVSTDQCIDMYQLKCNNFKSEYCHCRILPDIGKSYCEALLNCLSFNKETFPVTFYSFHLSNEQSSKKLLFVNITVTYGNIETLTKDYTSRFDSAKYLNFSYNNINRISNDSFLNLRELENLDLSHNNISELPQFKNLINLKVLNLSHNIIYTVKSSTFTNLKNLSILDLSENNLMEIPEDLFYNNHRLNSLSLSRNNIFNLPDDIFHNLSYLENLDLSHNNLKILPQWIQPLRNLRSLSVAHNKLTTIKNTFDCNSLVSLNLTGNPWICDENIYWLYLCLEKNKDKFSTLSSGICEKPKYAKNKPLTDGLEIVHLNKKINESEICNFCNCTVLIIKKFISVTCINMNLTALPNSFPNKTRQIDLSNNQITSLILKEEYISQWAGVRYLRLSNNSISSLHTLEGSIFLKSLIELNISNNKLKDIPIHLLDQLTRFEIYLGGNPWKCDCNTVRFQTWLLDHYQNVIDIENVRCAVGDNFHSNSVIHRMQKSDLCPQVHVIDYLDILNVVIGILIIIIISKVTYDYWRQKQTGKLPRFFSLNLQ